MLSQVKLFRASYESRNFDFEAFAETEFQARAELTRGLARHAIEYNFSPDWWSEDGITVREIHLGKCYRDRELVK